MKEFNRKIRLVEYFDGTEDTDISLVRNKSDFIPPPERNHAVDKFISTVEEFPKTKPNAILKPNIVKSEANAIKSCKMIILLLLKKPTKAALRLLWIGSITLKW